MSDPVYFGFSLPFVSSAGVLPLQADERIIKNDLMALLQTIPGQRVMRPTFGVGINSFVFESMTNSDMGALRSEIIKAVQRFETRVKLTFVDVSESPTVPNTLRIKIQGHTIINKNKLFEIELSLNLTGGVM